MKKIFFFLTLGLFSCQYENLQSINPADKGGTADFNFNVESIYKDTISVGQSTKYNLYIRQQNTYIKGQTYFVTFKISDNVEANAFVMGKYYKTGDIITIPYDSIVNANYRAIMVYKPRPAGPQSYSISFECKDQLGTSKAFSKNLTIL